MADYSLEALGSVVRSLRAERGWTQQRLGEGAEYSEKGAAVSINRLEKGRLAPTQEKLAGVARALGLTVDDLEARAVGETQRSAGAGELSNEARVAAIIRASEQRAQLAQELERLKAAREKAEQSFLMPLRELASRLVDATELHEADVLITGAGAADATAAEAAIQFARFGVSKAFAGPIDRASAGTKDGGPSGVQALAEAVALGAAPLGAVVRDRAALKGLAAVFGLSVAPFTGGAGVLAAAAAGTAVIAILERQENVTRTRRQQESAEKLAEAEAEIAATQPSVDVLLDVIPRAAELFDYISVHAAHALTRWGTSFADEGDVAWEELSEADQQRYHDFVFVAAAELSLAGLDLKGLAGARDDELAEAGDLANQIVRQARQEIHARV